MTDLRVTFGLCVKAHRRRLDLTQQQLADQAGLSLDTVAKIESGSVGASFATIDKLTKIFRVDASELFRIETDEGRFSPKLTEITARIAALSEGDLIWLAGIIDAALRPRPR